MADLGIEKMTTKEKLIALEQLWDALVHHPSDIPSPAWHEDVLNARANRVVEGKSEYIEWSEAKKQIIDQTK